MGSGVWRIWVDTGGTFTDCLAVDPEGGFHRAKVLSSGVIRRRDGARIVTEETGLEAPVLAAHAVTGTPQGQPLPPLEMRLATTRGTNALLTRSGNPPALFVTAGFADLLPIGTQQRPDLFALSIRKPAMLYAEVVEVPERLAADGAVVHPLEEEALRAAADGLVRRGIRTAAVALLHAYRQPLHERRAAAILREAGFTRISLSSALAPFIKILPRAETAVVDAYLAPVIDAYLDGVRRGIGDTARLHVLTSAGGLVRGDHFHPKDSLLSGPAGGVVGAAQAGRRAGFRRLIAFDMGGTSADVSRIEGEALDYVFEHTVGEAHLVAPALAIESVAAGGGSICRVDRHGQLRVGPESAGADPGPACYGAGGPLTITDVHLLLGRLDPARFGIPIDPEAAARQADALMAAVSGGRTERDALLAGLLDLADEAMADAIRRISVRRGYDPAEYALVAFGGAGGLHACSVAARLGMKTVLLPPDAGLLSARGLGAASLERFAERQTLAPLASLDLPALLAELEDEASAAVRAEGAGGEAVTVRRRILRMRLAGQETALEVEGDGAGSPQEAFAQRFASVYGYRPDPALPVEVESVRVIAASGGLSLSPPDPARRRPPAGRRLRLYTDGAWREALHVDRETLAPGAAIDGPALIAEAHATLFLPPGWRAKADAEGMLVAARSEPSGAVAPRQPRAVAEELFARRFAAVAEEMGEQLRRTALSVNVKERLDYSCALLGPDGDLVATAAHIPVHLGALGACVRRLRAAVTMAEGEHWVTNHPAFGGSHLPDVTVVTPLFRRGRLLGYVASRAHHAEIGGTRPGSMPPDAATLAEEGVVIPPTRWEPEALRRLLTEAPYPTRALGENLADLAAAVAANRRGAQALRELAENHGAATLRRMRQALAARSARLVREALRARGAGTFAAEERLDDGAAVRVRVEVASDGAATFDFTGTSATHPGNLNAPPAVTSAAALYVLRLLVAEPLPLNEGLLSSVRLVLPPDTLVNPSFDPDPRRCPAVVGGNTEVSQKVASALVAALGLAAGSQGTMNNILFGDGRFGFYETVCGGAGATASGPGASAVHTHMTNTRLTDAEILEARYPVRLERCAIRRGSGGAGRHPGGEGVLREYRFLAPVRLSLLTQGRICGGRGMRGGGDGAPGRQWIVRADGTREALGAVAAADLASGDRLILETPGGGGWGA